MSKVKQKQIKRRAEIIEAAIVLMNGTPFEELSVNDICAAAGISVGSFYHYFYEESRHPIGLFGLIDDYLIEEVFPKLDHADEAQNS
jgi:AcrR family transcriptional regulator